MFLKLLKNNLNTEYVFSKDVTKQTHQFKSKLEDGNHLVMLSLQLR